MIVSLTSYFFLCSEDTDQIWVCSVCRFMGCKVIHVTELTGIRENVAGARMLNISESTQRAHDVKMTSY